VGRGRGAGPQTDDEAELSGKTSNQGQKLQVDYLYGSVCPESGEVALADPATVNVELFLDGPKEFASEVEPARTSTSCWWWQGWVTHTGEEVRLPEGEYTLSSTSGSPELQPRRSSPLTNEAIGTTS